MLLDFLQHIIKSSSLMFANPSCQPDEYPDTTQSCTGTSCSPKIRFNNVKNCQLCKNLMCFLSPPLTCPHSFLDSDFSKWVAVRLLRVAAAPDCDVIHGRVSTVLCSLLHTLRTRAPFICSGLTRDLIFLCQELGDILYVHVATLAGKGHAHTQKQWPVTLECFRISSVCTSTYLTPSTLALSSPAALESLSAVTIGVVTDALRGVVSRRDVSVAWETACAFLASGNTRLRKTSMVMLRNLVELGGFPQVQCHEFFTAYLHLLETHSCTATANKDLDKKDLYEGELLHLTCCVFQSSGVSHSHFEPIYLSQVFECVCTLGGSGVKLGTEVKESLCWLFGFLLSVGAVYESAVLLRRQRVTEVCRMLASTVGTENQAEVRFASSCFLCQISCFYC